MTNFPKALTIEEACERASISKPTYHKLKRLGYGPDELYLPGRMVRITAAAFDAWMERLATWAASEAGRRELERRREQARAASRAAVASEKHISKQRLAAKAAASRPAGSGR